MNGAGRTGVPRIIRALLVSASVVALLVIGLRLSAVVARVFKDKRGYRFSDAIRPRNSVTRQEFARMIVRTMGYGVRENGAHGFADIKERLDPSDPLFPGAYIAACVSHGLVMGKSSTTFAPDEKLTRAQLITMVARAGGLRDVPLEYLPPFGEFTPAHYSWARAASHYGWLDDVAGVGANYDFAKAATRTEITVLLSRLCRRTEWVRCPTDSRP